MASSPAKYSGQSLYAFCLPLELLDVLHVRLNALVQQEVVSDIPTSRHEEAASSLGCSACGVLAFESLTDQRRHFRTDWHRYNCKLRLGGSGKAPVSEEAFSKLVETLDDSLSGSASSDSTDSDASSQHAVSRLMRQASLSHVEEEHRTVQRSPLLWLTAESIAPDTQFGLFRTIFPSSDARGRTDPVGGWTRSLRDLQVHPEVPKASKKAAAALAATSQQPDSPAVEPAAITPADRRTWTFFFLGGGHFAGMVVSLVPKLSRGQAGKIDSNLQILAHKTYHRYTTRRKQGGSQSTNDAAKGTAKSVGSQLRRAQEITLMEDIRALIGEWTDLVTSSEIVFLRASKANSRIFYDYDAALLRRGDPRIRSVPFSTRRPTLAELERCFHELTRVKVSHLTADALAALDESEMKKLAPKPVALPAISEPSTPAAVPQLSDEEIRERDRWNRVIEMARRGCLDALISFVDRHSEAVYTGQLPVWLADHRSPTLLHIAVQADQPEIVRWLLYDCDANPTGSMLEDEHVTTGHSTSRPAYDLASSKATRNVFRRCMADRPERWDWSGAAHVPSPLTAEQEAKERARDEVKRKAREREEAKAAALAAEQEASARQEQAAKDQERMRRMTAQQPVKSGPQRLGGGPPQRVATALNGGLTDEQRMRMEREQRARAAEGRLRR